MKSIVPGEEGMSPLERGRRRYQRKEYASALSAFTEAVDTSTANLLFTALDHRAAAYEKLQRLQPALRDAKSMIDLKPESSKGYLRCGKVLQLKGENELAIKIYELGLRKVKIGTDDSRTMIQSMFNKMKRAQDPEKSLDPLRFLPLELAVMIVHNLAMRDRVICLAVSKPWKSLLESSYKLWTTLDTTSARKPMSLKSLRVHLRRSNYEVDHAIISLKAQFDPPKWTYLTKNCKNLRKLEICGSGYIGASLASALTSANCLEEISIRQNTHIRMHQVAELLDACQKTLLKINVHQVVSHRGTGGWPNLPKLQRLSLRATSDHPIILEPLARATPNIESIALNGWRLIFPCIDGWTKLQDLDFTNTNLRAIPKLPPTLRRLILRDNPHLQDVAVSEETWNPLPLLETFDCAGTDMTSQSIKNVIDPSIKIGNLRILSVGDRGQNTSIDLPRCDTLEELQIAYMHDEESYFITLVDRFPNLRKLDVSATKVTGVAVRHFVNSGIIHLKVSECFDISADAVAWARSQGVEVEFNFPSQATARNSFRNIHS
ncbi:hypothetical protein BJ875DRAFT_17711 [Amylocarpus encephaloides]|uniref:F-box domain-containing protein n=1 Tax=Amylocarpus encephaloides TaxID=45428 RepID=A0A9P7YIK7_9HELO|nr:hypothetical protein BJ875DRAFT_17711 [Amylocarpus encephaloides]